MLDPKFEWQGPKDGEFSHFFGIDLPQRFLEALNKLEYCGQGQDQYDVIIIDEGQDFYPSWWEGIIKLARNHCPERFYYFYDQDQNYNNIDIDESLKELKRVVKQATGGEFFPHILPYNYRNTKKIAEKMYSIAGLEYESNIFPDEQTHPEGDKPEEEVCSNSKDERRWIEQKLNEIKQKMGSTDTIVIVGLHHFNNSVFVNKPNLGQFKVFNPQEGKPGDDKEVKYIEYISCRRIKGIEYDYVIVTGFDPKKVQSSDELRLLLYLSASRAKKGLYLAYRDKKY